MSAPFAHTLGAITPEYAEAAGGEVEAVLAAHLFTLYPGEIACDCEWTKRDHDSRAGERRMIAAHVAHVTALVTRTAADTVLAEARAMCCDADTSLSHAARAEHARVMAIAERLAAAVRGLDRA